ncbi:lipopolysaccharide biosynthesis protein [Salinicoccus sp. Marseille-QA3877]
MKNIFRSLSYVFVANIINALSKFLIVIFIVKILSEYELGVYTLALAITAPVTLLFNMKLRSYIVSNDNIDFQKFMKFREVSNLFAFIFVVLISVLFYPDIAVIVILVALIKILDINTEYYQAYPNKEKKFDIPAILLIVKVTASTVMFFLVLYFTGSLTTALIIQTIFFFFYLQIEKKVNLSLVDVDKYRSNVNLKQLFMILIPLGMVQAMLSFSSNIPKYLLEQMASLEAVGIFAGILYIITIFDLLMTTLNQTLLPYLKDIYAVNIHKFNKFLNIYINILAVIVGLLFIIPSYFFGEFLLTVLFSEEFAEHSYLLYIFSAVISLSMSGWSYDSSLLISGALKLQPFILAGVSIITLVIGYVLVDEYGLLGAALTLLLLSVLNTVSKAVYYNVHVRRREAYQ